MKSRFLFNKRKYIY